MKPATKYIIPTVVLLAFVAVAYIVSMNPPETKRSKPSNAPQLNVATTTLKRDTLSLKIDSYGTVQPRTQSNLLPQVSGEITWISQNFREGGFFEKDDTLIQLDQRDYFAEVKIAESTLLSAEQTLSEEEARVEQARQDWTRLGNTEKAPDLVLRKPQLKAAEAKLYSAQATLAKAKLALERTVIKAPYTGRVLQKSVDIGQVVSLGTQLAEIYAVDYVEIRLPIRNSDLNYITLPESTRYTTNDPAVEVPVTFTSDLANIQHWQGNVVRTEGAFDTASQQLYVVAQINDPYGKRPDDSLPIKIGQYLTASISGREIHDALVIPNESIYQGSYVYIVENNILLRKEISIAWQNQEIALISEGLESNQNLVITPLGQVSSGTPVAIISKDGIAVTPKKSSSRPNKANRPEDGSRPPKGNRPPKGQRPEQPPAESQNSNEGAA